MNDFLAGPEGLERKTFKIETQSMRASMKRKLNCSNFIHVRTSYTFAIGRMIVTTQLSPRK